MLDIVAFLCYEKWKNIVLRYEMLSNISHSVASEGRQAPKLH
jgi:hypothetical protein